MGCRKRESQWAVSSSSSLRSRMCLYSLRVSQLRVVSLRYVVHVSTTLQHQLFDIHSTVQKGIDMELFGHFSSRDIFC